MSAKGGRGPTGPGCSGIGAFKNERLARLLDIIVIGIDPSLGNEVIRYLKIVGAVRDHACTSVQLGSLGRPFPIDLHTGRNSR